MGLMMCDGKFVSRDAVALVPTPYGTDSWKPVPHMEVIDAVTDVVRAHKWQMLEENFGLAREGQKMFGVMWINKSPNQRADLDRDLIMGCKILFPHLIFTGESSKLFYSNGNKS